MAEKLPSKKRKQEVMDIYTQRYKFLTKVDQYNLFCTICKSKFTCANSGEYDIKQHMSTTRHKELTENVKQNQTLFGMGFTKDTEKPSSLQEKVINAECIMTTYITQHNIPIQAANHMTEMFHTMFPDSRIAKEFACKKTKTTCIINETAADNIDSLVEVLKSNPFSISTDGSADRGENQLYPMVVRYFNYTQKCVVTEILALPRIEGASTGENIFKLMDNTLKDKNLNWQNCLSFCSDNAAVMMGAKKGVAAYVLKEEPSIFIQGCTCHLTHIAAHNASKALGHLLKPDELLIDIYYYLDKSSKRQKELNAFQDLYNGEIKKVLQFCSTRWLSLTQCITRLLELWFPLLKYVEVEMGKRPKKKTCDAKSKVTITLKNMLTLS